MPLRADFRSDTATAPSISADSLKTLRNERKHLMHDREETTTSEPGLDISEYIPGHDLSVQETDEPQLNEAQRNEMRKRRKLRRNIIKGILILILAGLLLSVGLELHRDVPVLVQYIFFYFLFEVMFTEDWTLLVTAGVMLLCFGLVMALILPWKAFVFLTCVALALFIRYEKKLWLRILNILVFGTWLMFSILVALAA